MTPRAAAQQPGTEPAPTAAQPGVTPDPTAQQPGTETAPTAQQPGTDTDPAAAAPADESMEGMGDEAMLAESAVPPPGFTGIYGRVTDEANGEGLIEATVKVVTAPRSRCSRTWTASTGWRCRPGSMTCASSMTCTRAAASPASS
ncbi:hypothetical protein ACLEPN_24305 [Myxococcus sp. 1LA]